MAKCMPLSSSLHCAVFSFWFLPGLQPSMKAWLSIYSCSSMPWQHSTSSALISTGNCSPSRAWCGDCQASPNWLSSPYSSMSPSILVELLPIQFIRLSRWVSGGGVVVVGLVHAPWVNGSHTTRRGDILHFLFSCHLWLAWRGWLHAFSHALCVPVMTVLQNRAPGHA